MSKSEYVIQVKNIVKTYNGKIVLNNISFALKRGELLAILGPPGSGKTTLLKIIAGLVKQDAGDVIINGRIVNDLPPYERGVSLVFETLALYPNMSVYENIASPLIAEKKDKEYIDKRIGEITKLLKIEHILDRKADKLSGGERQRVAIARALAKEAEIYLLDEPLSNLDAKIRYALRTEFKKLKSLLGKTIILATSDPSDALALGDNVVLLFNGAIIQEGRPSDIYYAPRNISIARYLTGNILNEVSISIDTHGDDVSTDIGREFSIDPYFLKVLREFNETSIILTSYADVCIIDKFIENCSGIKVIGEFIGYEYRGSEYLLYARKERRIFRSLRTNLPNVTFGEKVEVCIPHRNALLFSSKTGDLIR
ncbi:MAG: ABC transporter ATP-binding protein [Sulfolobales archaeon]|nr:ABC transporter ATP-binding protein [Sulfolobales archaeon]